MTTADTSASSQPASLAAVDGEIRASFDFDADNTTIIVQVKNTGKETATIIGTGWSYPFRPLGPGSDAPTGRKPSLDSLFAKPVPVVSGATVPLAVTLVTSQPFRAESDAYGCLGLFTENDCLPCPVRLCLLPVFRVSKDSFVVSDPKSYTIELTLDSASEIPDLVSVDGLDLSWTKRRVNPRQFHLSAVWQPPARFTKETISGVISVRLEGITQVLTHPLTIQLHRCAEPELVFATETPLRVNRGRQRHVAFELTNIGCDTLTLHEVSPIQPDEGQCILPDHGLSGLRLSPQERVTIPAVVVAGGVAGSISFGLQVFSDSPSLPVSELRQSAEVVSFPVASTPIGIDFGTVNSCVGHVDDTFMEVDLVKVPVETGLNQFVMKDIFPSVLHLESMPNDGSGRYAPAVSFVTQRADTVNVKELKSAFCKGEDTDLVGADGLERTFSTGHFITQFLANLLSHAEHSLQKTFADAVITVPTKYGMRTVDDMKNAVCSAGLDSRRIHVYDEATSAAMFYIRRGRDSEFLRPFNLPESYALAIIDIGGGTTDVSLLDVVDREMSDARHLQVTLRGTTGRIRFGGTHFNTRVENRWFADYTAACRSVGMELQSLDDLDEVQAQELMAPRADLRESIEKAKCLLGAMPQQPYGKIERPLASCKILAGDSAAELPTEAVASTLTHLSCSTLSDLLGRDLKDIISEVELIARALAKHPLGVVLLVGQSGQLQAVRDTVIGTFGPEKVALVPGDTAKSCVVKGALELHQLLNNPGGIAFEFRDLSKVLNARLGILWSGRHEMEFKEIVPIGRELPASGQLELPPHLIGRGDRFSVDLVMNFGAKDTIKGNENIARLGRFSCAALENLDGAPRLIVRVDQNMAPSVLLACGELETELQREE